MDPNDQEGTKNPNPAPGTDDLTTFPSPLLQQAPFSFEPPNTVHHDGRQGTMKKTANGVEVFVPYGADISKLLNEKEGQLSDRDLKILKRKQANRESARRSKERKKMEIDSLRTSTIGFETYRAAIMSRMQLLEQRAAALERTLHERCVPLPPDLLAIPPLPVYSQAAFMQAGIADGNGNGNSSDGEKNEAERSNSGAAPAAAAAFPLQGPFAGAPVTSGVRMASGPGLALHPGIPGLTQPAPAPPSLQQTAQPPGPAFMLAPGSNDVALLPPHAHPHALGMNLVQMPPGMLGMSLMQMVDRSQMDLQGGRSLIFSPPHFHPPGVPHGLNPASYAAMLATQSQIQFLPMQAPHMQPPQPPPGTQ